MTSPGSGQRLGSLFREQAFQFFVHAVLDAFVEVHQVVAAQAAKAFRQLQVRDETGEAAAGPADPEVLALLQDQLLRELLLALHTGHLFALGLDDLSLDLSALPVHG